MYYNGYSMKCELNSLSGVRVKMIKVREEYLEHEVMLKNVARVIGSFFLNLVLAKTSWTYGPMIPVDQ